MALRSVVRVRVLTLRPFPRVVGLVLEVSSRLSSVPVVLLGLARSAMWMVVRLSRMLVRMAVSELSGMVLGLRCSYIEAVLCLRLLSMPRWAVVMLGLLRNRCIF